MNKEILIKNTLAYYAILIILALIPQIFGFNASLVADIWKIFLLLGMLLLLCRKNWQFTLTSNGMLYILSFTAISIACLIVDTSVSISNVFNIGGSVLLIYLFFDCPVREKNIDENDLLKFFKIFSLFMLISCIYNMMLNFNQLLHITSVSAYSSSASVSFFDNKNTFGIFLTFGTISAVYLRVMEGKTKWMLLMILFFVNELMAMCRTAIVLTLSFLIISFLIGDKKTRGNRIVMLSVLFIAGLITYKYSPDVYDFVNNNLFGNTDSLDVRDGYVEKMLPLINGIHFILGYGDEQSRQLAVMYTGNQYYHNTYLHLLISGGLLKFGFSVVGIIRSLIDSIKLCILDRKSGYMCIVTIMTYLIYASIESIILFDTPVIAMVATIFVISIPRLLLNAELYSRNVKQGNQDEQFS